MPYRNEVQPLNLVSNFLAGRRAAVDEEAAQQVNALRATQVQRAQSVNALAQNPNATPEQYIRAGDASTGVALGNEQQSQATGHQQAVQELATLVQRANITSPQQARDFTRQVAQQYGHHFQTMGVDLNKSLGDLDSTPDDVLMQRLQQVAQFAAPPKPIEVNANASLAVPDAANPGKFTSAYTAPGAPAKPMDPLGQLNSDFNAGLMTKPDYDSRRTLLTTRAPGSAAAQGFEDPKVQALQAAIASSGYALPAGFRSQAQQLSLFHGLLSKYKDLDPADIAHLLASNAIDYKSITKATQTAAGIVGKVEVANNELQGFLPIARDASAAVDRGSFVPWNVIKQKGLSFFSDPNVKRLYIATQTIMNAYDLLASRGGTDAEKRAHTRKMLESADGPEAYNAALDMIEIETKVAGEGARKATKASSYENPPAAAPAAEAVQTATGPNGQKLYLRNGQWVQQ